MKKLITSFAFFLATAFVITTGAQAQSAAPKLEIVAPKQDQTFYGSKTPILFTVENFTLIDPQGQKPKVGQGHILAWIDETNPTVENAIKISSDTFTFSDLSYGDHTIKTELVTSDNKSLTPPIVVTVNFKTQELPSSTDASSTSFDKNTTIVILIIVALVIIAAWWYTKDEDLDDENQSTKSTKKAVKKTAKRKTVKKKK